MNCHICAGNLALLLIRTVDFLVLSPKCFDTILIENNVKYGANATIMDGVPSGSSKAWSKYISCD